MSSLCLFSSAKVRWPDCNADVVDQAGEETELISSPAQSYVLSNGYLLRDFLEQTLGQDDQVFHINDTVAKWCRSDVAT